MAAAEDFNIYDTQVRDIFRINNPQNNRVYWIVTSVYPGVVEIDNYDSETNTILSNFPTLISLNNLNAGYTYIRRNPIDPIYGGRKRKRRSLKGRKSRRRKSRKSRKFKRY